MRFSTVAGRSAASSSARSSGDNSNGTVGRPGCDRFIHGMGSSMLHAMHEVAKIGQISDERY